MRRSSLKSVSICPVPRTTEASGSSAIETGRPVSSRMRRSRFLIKAPPPVNTMPWSLISALSSGGVRSSATRMAFMMVAMHSAKASRISLSSMVMVLRHALNQITALDLHRERPVQRIGGADLILICSAVRSPISRLYFRFR